MLYIIHCFRFDEGTDDLMNQLYTQEEIEEAEEDVDRLIEEAEQEK